MGHSKLEGLKVKTNFLTQIIGYHQHTGSIFHLLKIRFYISMIEGVAILHDHLVIVSQVYHQHWKVLSNWAFCVWITARLENALFITVKEHETLKLSSYRLTYGLSLLTKTPLFITKTCSNSCQVTTGSQILKLLNFIFMVLL